MTAFRVLSLASHSVFELVLGLALMVAPFMVGAGAAAALTAAALGAVIAGLGLGAADDLSVAAHLALDHALTAGLLVAGFALAAHGDTAGALVVSMAAFAQLLLTVTTRYVRRAP